MRIYAHRGASGDFPENTNQAFQGAIDQHANAIEVDVQQAQDGFVILHDRYLEKTTNGSGQVIETFCQDIQKLDAGQGQKVPELENFLAGWSDKIDINLELKNISNLEGLCEIFEKYQSFHFEISSFNHSLLSQVQLKLPMFSYAALIAHLPKNIDDFISTIDWPVLNVDIEVVSEALVVSAHKHDKKVNVYTADNPKDLEFLKKIGVDGVFTNYPRATRNFLQG